MGAVIICIHVYIIGNMYVDLQYHSRLVLCYMYGTHAYTVYFHIVGNKQCKKLVVIIGLAYLEIDRKAILIRKSID